MKTKKELSAGGIVYRKTRKGIMEWLICQHSQHKGWVFPKGLVGDTDQNESMESAALREVKEEGGVQARIIDHTPVQTQYSYVWNHTQVHKTVLFFLMEYTSGDPKNHDWEMSDAKFVSEDVVKKLLSFPSDKEAFEKILLEYLKLLQPM